MKLSWKSSIIESLFFRSENVIFILAFFEANTPSGGRSYIDKSTVDVEVMVVKCLLSTMRTAANISGMHRGTTRQASRQETRREIPRPLPMECPAS